MSLLPSEPDTSKADDAEPRVIGVDDEDADEVLSALTAETARELLAELHEEPAPPAELSDRVDTSLQNTQYHLEKLENAGAIEVIDQIYSEKGREMNVYAPADQPLVIYAGNEEQSSGLRAALARFLSSIGVLAVASLAVQQAFGDGVSFGSAGGPAGGDAGDGGQGGAPPTDTTTPAPTPEEQGDVGIMAEETAEATTETPPATGTPSARDVPTDAPMPEPEATPIPDLETTPVSEATDVAEAALSLPPGLLFFLGGLTALMVVAAVWYLGK